MSWLSSIAYKYSDHPLVNKLELLLEMIGKYQFPNPVSHEVRAGEDIQLFLYGPRESMICYRIDQFGTVNTWAGKSNSDSGGLGGQGSFEGIGLAQLKSMLKMHKRFMISGRRKVLSNYTKSKSYR